MSELDVRHDDAVTIFTINRPAKRNAINACVADELRERFEEFDRSDQRVAIITGGGGNFSSGADLAQPPVMWRAYPSIGITTNKPIICAVDGWCVGGALVIAAMADLCVASEDARFWYPEGKVGLTGGIVATLAARLPHKSAMEIMLLGRVISGRRAYEMGLVNEVVPEGEHLSAALVMARELAQMAPLVLAALKSMVTEHTLNRSPAEIMARTQRAVETINNSADLAEGLRAFKEGRPAAFSGR